MAEPPERSPAENFADRVDRALEALWRGDAAELDELVGSEGRDDVDVLDVLRPGALPTGRIAVDAKGRPEIAGYVIQREIGRGGMGVVYEAEQAGTKRTVALKVMLGWPYASETGRRRFKREVQLAARLRHQNIVRILECGMLAGGEPYFAMERVEGVTLDRYLAASRPEIAALLRLFVAICDAVAHAHRHDVIHRDLKPGNVLVDEDGAPHILDFGLAKCTGPGDRDATLADVTAPGQLVGTYRYLSPEQVAGEPGAVDERTDVYALGVMLYEALTGALPFDADGKPSAILRQIEERSPARPSALSPDVDKDLETIVLKAMAKEQAHRYASADELKDDIARYLAGEPIRARRLGGFYVARKKLAKHRRLAAAGAAILVIAIAAGTARYLRHRSDAAAAAMAARRSAVRCLHRIEKGALTEGLPMAYAIHSRHRDLTAPLLVWAQATYRLGLDNDDMALSQGAVAALDRRLSREPENSACAALLAEMYGRLGDAALAARYGDLARAHEPDSAEGWFLRSLATMDPATAIAHAQRAVDLDARHVLAWERLAYLRLAVDELEGALEANRVLLGLSGPQELRYRDAIHILLRLGRYEEALARADDFVAFRNDSVMAHRSRGIAHLCLRNYRDALADYAEAIRIGTGTTWERYHQATVLWILGDHEQAASRYREHRKAVGRVGYADARLYLVLSDAAVEAARGGRSAEAARLRDDADSALAEARAAAEPTWWVSRILDCLAGALAPEELVRVAQERKNPEDTCEAYYYAAERSLLDHRPDRARRWYQACVDTGVVVDIDTITLDPMNEYHLARWRLDSLFGTSGE